MLAVMKDEFLFRFKKYWKIQYSSSCGWFFTGWLFIYGGILFANTEDKTTFLSVLAAYLFWVIFILLLSYIGDLSLFLPNQLNKTMFFMPIKTEDRKKYISSVLCTKTGIISVFLGVSSLILAITGWFPAIWIVCMLITGIFWGIVVIFADTQLRQDPFGSHLQVKREVYQTINLIIYILYICSFAAINLKLETLPPWWVQGLVWLMQLALLVYTVLVKMPVVLCGHDYETVHRRDTL